MKKRVMLILSCLLLSVGLIVAQTTRINGTVVDSNGEPVVSASVVVKGTQVGTITDPDGKFSVNVPEGRNTLVFTLVGMLSVEERANQGMRVVMEYDTKQLDEVEITVAYGTVKKHSFTGSAGVITSDKITNRTTSNVTKALQGTVAGLVATSGSGQPGSTATIRVRGVGSMNSSNDPLYVVDGAPFDGAISSINNADIESITVLKDASAGALYGARGGNGVILITTKRGANKDGKVSVNLRANWGFLSRAVPRYDLMDEAEYIQANYHMYRNKAIYTDGVAPSAAGAAAINAMTSGSIRLFGENEQYNPYNMPIAQLIDPVTGAVNPNAQLRYSQNWLDESERSNPMTQEYIVSANGGNAKNQYYFSLGYLNEEGLIQNTSFDRITGRLSVDSQVQKWLRMGGAVSFSLNKTNNRRAEGDANVTNIWYAGARMAPIYPVYEIDANGSVVRDETGKAIFDSGSNRASGGTPNYNAVGQLSSDKFYTNSDNFHLRSYAHVMLDDEKYGWAKGLGFNVDISSSIYNARETRYWDQRYGSAITSKGDLYKGSTRYINYTFTQALTYKRTFENTHTVDFLGAHEYYELKTNNLYAQRSKFPFPGLYELNTGASLDAGSSSENNYRIDSYLSRLRYTYADKYNFDASLRTDGSSRFHTDSRWGTFWSIGGNWRASQEEFMQKYDWLDNLSIRASYGEQGNDALLKSDGTAEYYAWQSFYTLGRDNALNNGSVLSSLESRGLKWEKNGNFNTGFDISLFNRINLTFEYYNRKTSDMLLAVPMAPSLGFDSYWDNVGNISNRGIEFSLAVDVLRLQNFAWRFTALGSTQRNRIEKLATEKPIIDGSRIYKVGSALYSWYLPKGAGVDPNTGKQLYWVWDESDPVTDERLSEPYISDDPSKAANSRTVVGTRLPHMYGALGSEFTFFKNFNLSVLTTYSIGGKALDSFYTETMYPQYYGTNFHKNASRAWKYPGDVTDIPRLEVGASRATTSSDLVDASYFAIKNITFSYELPKKLLKSVGMEQVRLNVSADNLVMFTHLKGFNPESSISNNTTYSYTPTRTISFGVNIGF